MQTTETFGDDGSGPPTPPRDKAREVKSVSQTLSKFMMTYYNKRLSNVTKFSFLSNSAGINSLK